MVFTGYTLAELRASTDPDVAAALQRTDLLVDGRYRADLPEARRRWVGSSNQQVHFLSPRHDPADPCWLQPNTLELRLSGGVLTVNGFPVGSPERPQ